MAYGNKYQIKFHGREESGPTLGNIYIAEKDYVGSVTILKLAEHALNVKYIFDNWDSHIIGLRCQFNIVNDNADFYAYLELMTATERQFKVTVQIDSPSSRAMPLFEGFIDCNNSEQRMLNYQTIRLTASSYLSKLSGVRLNAVDTLQALTFIDLIDDILTSTGRSDNIRINSSLYPEAASLSSGQTLFNRTGVFTELFWKNNIDRKSALEILNIILKTFDSYIYWWNGYWYIEQFDDLYETSKTFVEYTTGVSYGESDSGSNVIESSVVQDIHDMQFINQSQILKTIPGYQLIQVNLNLEDGVLLNLVNNDWYLATGVSGTVPYPDKRSWQYWDGITHLQFTNYYALTEKSIFNYKTISNAIFRVLNYSDAQEQDSSDKTYRGLYTKFDTTIDENSRLQISWKWASDKGAFGVWDDELGWHHAFHFYWYLRITPGNNYVVYNYTTKTWEIVAGTEQSALQEVVINSDDSDFDRDNIACKITINIPLNELGSSYYGDQTFVLGIGTETVELSDISNFPVELQTDYYSAYFDGYDYQAAGQAFPIVVGAAIGDVAVTTNSTLKNNVVEGSINTDFLNRKEVTLELSDVESQNYKSGILIGTNLDTRTAQWTNDGVNFYTIAEKDLQNLFRLYHQTQQKITARIHETTQQLRPFTLLQDSKQSNKKFLLIGINFFPTKDVYNLEFFEFDADSTINLT